jgi:hypothetical protein
VAQNGYLSVKQLTMKTRPFLLLPLAILAVGSLFASDSAVTNVMVNFNEPGRFRDARSYFNGDTNQSYLTELSKHLQKEATRQIPANYKLEVTITEIDLAGEFDPTNPNLQDVRILKDIYIPRLNLSFKLIDAGGKTVKEGERRLSDPNFLQNIGVVGRDQPLHHDKALLTNWARKEFRP